MLSVSSPLASAAERGATKCRLRTLLPRRSSQVVKPAQAGALTTPLPESCRAASSARIASRALWSAVSLAESAAFVAYEASSAVSALEAWSAVMPASRLASCAATKPRWRYFGVYVQRKSVHRGEQGGQRAGVRLAEEGGVQGRRGDGVQESGRYLRVHLRGSVDARLQGVRCQGAGVRLGGLQPQDGGVCSRAWRPAPRR